MNLDEGQRVAAVAPLDERRRRSEWTASIRSSGRGLARGYSSVG